MTLLEMLDVLETGCTTLQQRSSELAAALDQASNNVTPAADDAPKRRSPAKRKRKAAKGRRAPKKQLTLPMAETGGASAASAASPNNEEGPKRGKRQALGMSFSKLRASIQARRGERREGEEVRTEEQPS